MKHLKSAIYSFFCLVILLTGILFFLLATTPGLYTVIALANMNLPGKLRVQNLEGRLLDHVSFDQLTYTDSHTTLQFSHGGVSWQWRDMLQSQITITSAQADQLIIFLNSNHSPVKRFNHVDLRATVANKKWRIQRFTAIDNYTRFSLQGSGQFTSPYALSATLLLEPLNKQANGLQGQIKFGGDKMLYYWEGQLQGAMHGDLHGTLKNGVEIHTQANWHDVKWPINPSIELQSSQGHLALEGTLADMVFKANLHFEAPTEADWQINGRLKNNQATVKSILNLNPKGNGLQTTIMGKTIATPHTQLQLNLTAKNVLTKPVIQSEIILNDASFTAPQAGVTFSPIQAKLETEKNHWVAKGSITSNGQVISFNGKGELSPQFTGQLSLQGDNVPVINTGEYKINISPQLTAKFNPTSMTITGDILVPNAQLKPIAFSNTVGLSEDVVFVDREKPLSNPFNITTDVQLKMGQNVALTIKGLNGLLDGSLRIKQSPQTPMIAIGELTIRNGKYRAYGQNLVIEQGQLLFTGGVIDNPSVNIRAVRHFDNATANFEGTNQLFDFNSNNLETLDFGSKTTVGIEVTGRLNTHKIKLFSIPSNLSQADILSLLILGKPASQASKSGGQLLLAAMSSMNLDSGTKGLQLLEQLKQSIGVDFSVQNNSQYNQQTNQTSEKTALVVGKSLTKRLYLSYNIGVLQEDSNVLTLKYLLNKFLSIQVSASSAASALDLLYTHKKD